MEGKEEGEDKRERWGLRRTSKSEFDSTTTCRTEGVSVIPILSLYIKDNPKLRFGCRLALVVVYNWLYFSFANSLHLVLVWHDSLHSSSHKYRLVVFTCIVFTMQYAYSLGLFTKTVGPYSMMITSDFKFWSWLDRQAYCVDVLTPILSMTVLLRRQIYITGNSCSCNTNKKADIGMIFDFASWKEKTERKIRKIKKIEKVLQKKGKDEWRSEKMWIKSQNTECQCSGLSKNQIKPLVCIFNNVRHVLLVTINSFV